MKYTAIKTEIKKLAASDVVTRLPWDLLLAIRMGEYVFGHTEFTVEFIYPFSFCR